MHKSIFFFEKLRHSLKYQGEFHNRSRGRLAYLAETFTQKHKVLTEATNICLNYKPAWHKWHVPGQMWETFYAVRKHEHKMITAHRKTYDPLILIE